ncbi:hypothetical protein GCM10009792_25240 [Microcella alkalica]
MQAAAETDIRRTEYGRGAPLSCLRAVAIDVAPWVGEPASVQGSATLSHRVTVS